MGLIYDASEPHVHDYPSRDDTPSIFDLNPGSIWKCDGCGKEFILRGFGVGDDSRKSRHWERV